MSGEAVYGGGEHPFQKFSHDKEEKVVSGIEEEQNRLFQNVPLWHVDYFALKSIKTQQTQEYFCFFLNCLEELRCGEWPRKRVVTRDNFI